MQEATQLDSALLRIEGKVQNVDFYVDSRNLVFMQGQRCYTPFEAVFVCDVKVLDQYSIDRLVKNYIRNHAEIEVNGSDRTCKKCSNRIGMDATGAQLEALSKLLCHQLLCEAYQTSLRLEKLGTAPIQAALSNSPLNKELRLQTLEADPFVSTIRPYNVFCIPCNAWKKLGFEYALSGWHLHKRKKHGYNHISLEGYQERRNAKSRNPTSSDEGMQSSVETDSEPEHSVLDIDELVDIKYDSAPERNCSSTLVGSDLMIVESNGTKRVKERPTVNERSSMIVLGDRYTKEKMAKVIGHALEGHSIPLDVAKITIHFN